MKHLISIALMLVSITTLSQPATLVPGKPAPAFTLPDVSGKNVSFADFPNAKGYIIVFTCNTCPVSQAYEQRIIDLHAKYASLGFPVIAINPNDPEISKGDNPEAMVQRAKDKGYRFPYLFDKGQQVTNAYGARATPHIFLVARQNTANTVVYTGAIDNDPEYTNNSRINYLDEAIKAIVEGKTPATATTRALGCSVKRRS